MTKRVLFALAAALFSLVGFSLASAARAQTPDADTTTDTATPAMWRVADEDSEVILLGTFHILPPALQWRTAALNDAIETADTVYFEVEADTADAQSKTVSILMTQGFNPAGVMLSSMLDDADAQALNTIARSLGLPVSAIDPMRPWQAFLTLSVQFIIQQGFDPGAGVDSVLLAEARTRGKDLRFFETIEQQLGFFTSFDPETEKDLLVVTIQDWENQQEMFDELFNAWRLGNVGVIDEQMNGTMREQAPKVYDRLIVERNKAWAAELADEIRNGAGKTFVAVGVGHLVGDENSVPALLKAEGFDVSRYGAAANDNAPADDIKDLLQDIEAQQ